MAVMSEEQSQTRLLAILLPLLTLSTHTLLAISFALPSDATHATWSLAYNLFAAFSSVLGLFGAIRFIPSFVSAYTLTHTTTLIFVTLALLDLIAPFSAGSFNPVISSWTVDESALCRDIGWDDDWLAKCTQSLHSVVLGVTVGGCVLVLAQWWALYTVRQWCWEMRFWRLRERLDVESRGVRGSQDFLRDGKGRE